DLFLSLTVHEKRDSFCELKLRTGIQAHEFLTFQFESHGHHFPVRSADAQDLCVLENRNVEVHRLFSLTIEPQEWSNFWHVVFLLMSDLRLRASPRCRRAPGCGDGRGE